MNLAKRDSCVITPATGDLWAAGVVILEVFSRRPFSRARTTAAHALAKLEGVAAPSTFRSWTCDDWADWGEREGLAGEACDLIRARRLATEWFEAAVFDEERLKVFKVAHRVKVAALLRSRVAWHPMPKALFKILEATFAAVVADRPRDARSVVATLRDRNVGVDDIPLDARRAPPPHGDADIRGTLGSIASAFELRGQASLAMRVHCEWLGASEGALRTEAADRFAAAAQHLGGVPAVDLSREGRLHWKRLDTPSFLKIADALAKRRPQVLESLFLCRQDLLDTTLEPLRGLNSLVSLDVAWCDRLGGTLEPLAALENLELLCLHFCVGIRGNLAPLEKLLKLRDLDLGCCMDLDGSLEPLSKLKRLTRLNLRACAKLRGTLGPLSECESLKSLDIRDTFVTGSIARLFYPLHNLEILDLKGTAVEDVGEFKRAHPNCRITGFSLSRMRYRARQGSTAW